MKKVLYITTVLFVNWINLAVAQSEEEVKDLIKKLDIEHADAVLQGDLKAMGKYWTEDFIVNNPFNEVDQADRIHDGRVSYSSFLRESEAIKLHGNTAIVMGKETVVPKGKSPKAGQTIYRRYTNIWMKRDGQWRLVARHASVICDQ
jgi:ketosteroid isomerase-like protein